MKYIFTLYITYFLESRPSDHGELADTFCICMTWYSVTFPIYIHWHKKAMT